MKKFNVLNLSRKLFYFLLFYVAILFIILSFIKIKQNFLVTGSFSNINNETYFTFYFLGEIEGINQEDTIINLISLDKDIALKGKLHQISYINDYKLVEGNIGEYIIKLDNMPENILTPEAHSFYLNSDRENSLIDIVFKNIFS